MPKLSEAEKWKRKAERKTAKDRKREGLFADFVEETTAADLYHKHRIDKAVAVGRTNFLTHPGWIGLKWIEIRAIESFAEPIVGEMFSDLRQYIRSVYPMPDYGRIVWKTLLTGRKNLEFCFRREATTANNLGFTLIPERVFPPVGFTPITDSEFETRFPSKFDHHEPDDGGLFERIIKLVKGRASRRHSVSDAPTA